MTASKTLLSPTTLYQHGTLALLVPGLLAGTITMGELLKHGDTGIGTGEGLDGELIILDGVPYQVTSDGKVTVVDDDFTMPFVTVHQAAFKKLVNVSDTNQFMLEQQVLQEAAAQNTFFSIEVTGTFTHVKTRAVEKSVEPYHTLAQTARNQGLFEKDDVRGTLVSYYSPEIFDGAAVGGFHHHFISDDHDFGGHVLSFHVDQATVGLQVFDTLEQHLPTKNKPYMDHDFSDDQITETIRAAEK
ncbi:acetolactate decarboxylase [Secundilactobacillus similis]|uniref:Alpha-acetolactate decarboxylase n=1 Tax=Secundilactobacillus similis DSM 23365 = JCM 2765 TaxID=1423804 RepID=A0A0R2FAP2_9LACO|nr:acetolactate decarboxylase [Secundilactobacillus similis]KRN25441.1 alpha-acetolactate decarboxylase [Secundilactobacillus similis DSM 23365 = JCM 2765]